MPLAEFQMNAVGGARRGSIGDADDGKSVVHAESLAARASQCPEVDLYAIVPPQVRVRRVSTIRESPIRRHRPHR